MATNNIKTFLDTIQQGIKPNMFSVDISFPTDGKEDAAKFSNSDRNLTNILCKSAALPGSNLGVIEVPFRGRTVKIAGDRTFDTWTATFFADAKMEVRALFEDWANSINTHEANTAPRFLPNNGGTGYMATLYVSQLEKDDREGGSAIRTYKLHHCFPTNVSPIDLAYDSNDQIAEFTVEWQYSFFTATTANAEAAGAPAKTGASPRDVV
tara:strand:- start:86 stop:715 length:630 start_codon:yes stop_codon:yes gene_type:complete